MEKINKKTIELSFSILVLLLLSFQCAIASEVTENNVIDLVNKSRKSIGLNVLVENYMLSKAASEKADDMIGNSYFAHTSPSNVTPWYWIEENEYDYNLAGENLAINFSKAEEQHRAWMDSPEHRKNILNSNFQEIGVAVRRGIIDGSESLIAVQMFGSRDNFEAIEIESNISDEKTEEIYKERKVEKKENDFSGIVLNLGRNGGGTLFPESGKISFYESRIATIISISSFAVILIVIAINPIIIMSFLVMSAVGKKNEEIYVKPILVK